MPMVKLWFAKTHPDGIIPSKRREDAGYDVYVRIDEDYVCLAPHETRIMSTGIASACEAGYYFQIQERGSTGTKGIAKRCGVIDSGYRGEWLLSMTNLNTYPLYFAKPHMKEYFDDLAKREKFIVHYINKAAAQAVVLPVPDTFIEELPYEELLKMESQRGTGKLGSSEK